MREKGGTRVQPPCALASRACESWHRWKSQDDGMKPRASAHSRTPRTHSSRVYLLGRDLPGGSRGSSAQDVAERLDDGRFARAARADKAVEVGIEGDDRVFEEAFERSRMPMSRGLGVFGRSFLKRIRVSKKLSASTTEEKSSLATFTHVVNSSRAKSSTQWWSDRLTHGIRCVLPSRVARKRARTPLAAHDLKNGVLPSGATPPRPRERPSARLTGRR